MICQLNTLDHVHFVKELHYFLVTVLCWDNVMLPFTWVRGTVLGGDWSAAFCQLEQFFSCAFGFCSNAS